MSQIPPLANYFWEASRSSNCCLLFNFSSASFIRQLSWWYKSVVKEDCSFSNFGTEAFPVSCYLGHRFCTRCITGEIHSTVMTKSNDPGTFSALIIEKFQIVHRTLNRRLFSRCMLKCGTYDSNINTRKDNLSVILSSLPLSHRFMLSQRVIH